MKLLIVDDELQIRKGLKAAIDWSAIGIKEILTAENGVVALEICKTQKPEIIITDIKMPGISGIELAEKIAGLYNVSKIILLSGYSEFDYAKAAIKIGVVDYLLKPVKISELTKLVTSTIALIQKEAVEQKDANSKLLTEILRGNVNSKEQLALDFKTLEISGGDVVCGVIREDILYENYKLIKKGEPEERLSFAKAFLKAENIKTMSMPQELVFIFYLNDAILRSNYKYSLTQKIASLNLAYKEAFGLTISAGISGVDSALDLQTLYKQGVKALDTRFYKGSEQASFYSSAPLKKRLQPLLNIDEKALVQCISLFQTDKVLGIIDQQFGYLAQNKCVSHKVIEELLIGIKNILFNTISSKGIDIVKIIENNEALFDMQVDFTTLESYNNWLQDLCQLMMIGLGDMDKKRYSSEMIKVVEYINQNYANEISLDIIAGQANKSSNYFSYIFKREMGVNFSEYLNETRIEKSKELLTSTNNLIYEIAEDVGFKDYAYYTKVFRKICGMSPKEYRESK